MDGLTAREIVAAIQRGELSSEEVLDHHLRRIGEVDGAVNAVVALDVERAREDARRVDRERRAARDEPRPLLGLPMTVKESFDVAGLPTTFGDPALAANVAARDADAVARLREAGAVVFGKTNVPLGLADCQTFNELYGVTRNPWSLDRTPGGSSGGGAAALAAGMTPLELGSDMAGSIRTPAHFSGVFGHKPSYGLVSQVGQSVAPTLAQPDIAVVGPLARDAADLRAAMDVLTGPSAYDRPAWRSRLQAPRFDELRGLRIAVIADHPSAEVDRAIRLAIQSLAEDLADGFGVIVDTTASMPVDLDRNAFDFTVMMRASTPPFPALSTRRPRDEPLIAENDRSYRAALRRAATLTHHDWIRLHERRSRQREAWREFFSRYDLLLCPVHTSLAFPHDTVTDRADRTLRINGHAQDYNRYLLWPAIAGLSYLPSTVRPIGKSGGLPIGVQIIGDYLDDASTLRFAELLDDVIAPLRYPAAPVASAERVRAPG